jgi:hypothetical protein
MAVNSTVIYCLLGASTFYSTLRFRARDLVAQALAVLVWFVVFTALVGYAFGVEAL